MACCHGCNKQYLMRQIVGKMMAKNMLWFQFHNKEAGQEGWDKMRNLDNKEFTIYDAAGSTTRSEFQVRNAH